MSTAELQAIDRRIEALLKSQENTDLQMKANDKKIKKLGSRLEG